MAIGDECYEKIFLLKMFVAGWLLKKFNLSTLKIGAE